MKRSKTKYLTRLRPSINSLRQPHSHRLDCTELTDGGHVEWRLSMESQRITGLCAAAALLLYINTIYADFAYDDSRAIVKNQDLRPETPISNVWADDFWGTPLQHSGSHKSYRPLVVLTFRLNYALHRLAPGGYHLLNAVLHSISTALYTIILALVIRRDFITLVAGLLFAIHPIHTEAVAGIVGRADVLCSIFYCLALLTFVKYCEGLSLQHNSRFLWIVLTFILVTASTLSKEIGITVLGVCAVYSIFHHAKLTMQDITKVNKNKLKDLTEATALLTMFGVVLLALRLYFMGFSPPSFSPADNPAADNTSLLTRTLTFLYLPVFNFLLLIYPVTLSFDWSMNAIPLVESALDFRVYVTILFYGALLWLIQYSLSFFCRTFDSDDLSYKWKENLNTQSLNGHMTSNGNVTCSGHDVMSNGSPSNHRASKVIQRRVRRDSSSSAESNSCDENQNEVIWASPSNQFRHHMTLLLGISLTVLPFLPATNLFFYVGFVVAERVLYIPSMGFCLLAAEAIYQIYKQTKYNLIHQYMFYICLIAIATLLSVRSYYRCMDWRSEENLYTSGIYVNPAKAWGNLANVLNNRGDVAGAENAYKSALSHRGNMADVHYNLGILLQNQQRYNEALEEYKMAITCRPRLTVAHLNKGIVLALLGQHKDAETTYKDCTKIDTSGLKDPRMHELAKISAIYNLGRLYAEKKEYRLAINTYKYALDQRPEYYAPHSIYNLLGEAYFYSEDLDNAEKSYRQALENKPDHVPAHLTMARLMNVQKRYRQAEEWYEKALKIDDTDSQNYYHYALYLGEHGRHQEAVDLWTKASILTPTDFDVVFNLASALRQVGNNAEAVQQYERAVKLSPKTASAHMNLGAMYHINKDYSRAEKSYTRALQLDPNDQTTKNNLKKLQNILRKSR